jgi:hypothetical protein
MHVTEYFSPTSPSTTTTTNLAMLVVVAELSALLLLGETHSTIDVAVEPFLSVVEY